MNTSDEHVETLELDQASAAILAEQYRPGPDAKNQPQIIKTIPFSLLSAEHIRDVVKETGLIAPFYTSSHRKARLKKAAYEGRIGSRAFMYDADGKLVQIFSREYDETLKVPQNQIVFVESDLDFRLPEFIALRFNLQIQHVHRGLLLGTGPLVDPGYWGKLCIPLHNLTDQDYFIPKDEGLIWLEFTKTTSSPNRARNPLGRPPLGGEFWGDITKFLDKASKQYGHNQVPIRSALPTMFNQSEKAARKAQKSATQVRDIGFLAGIAAIIGICGLWYSYYSDMNDQFEIVRPKIEGVDSLLQDHITRIEKFGQDDLDASVIIPDIKDQLREQKTKNDELEAAIKTLQANMKSIKFCRKDPNRPDSTCLN